MKEIRIAEIRAEAPAGAEGFHLWGRPIVFDTPTTINDPAGEYIEIIPTTKSMCSRDWINS